MKGFCAGITISLLIFAAGARAGQRPYEVGTVYIYFSGTSDEQIVRDLETIAATGISTVQLYPPFLLKPGNPQPDFSKTDVVLKHAQRLGLRVMPTVFWSGLLPDFAAAKWPDRFSPIIDAEAREARLSFANPEVIDLIDYYSTATVQHFKDVPCVIAYNLWDEPHMEGFPGDDRGPGDRRSSIGSRNGVSRSMAALPPGTRSGTTFFSTRNTRNSIAPSFIGTPPATSCSISRNWGSRSTPCIPPAPTTWAAP